MRFDRFLGNCLIELATWLNPTDLMLDVQIPRFGAVVTLKMELHAANASTVKGHARAGIRLFALASLREIKNLCYRENF